MRSHAQAPSAGSIDAEAGSLGRFLRGAFANAGAAGERKGSGASAFCTALLAALVLTLLLPPAAHAGLAIDHVVAVRGDEQGEVENPRDIAINLSSVADGATDPQGDSVDGYVYVADAGNQRIQVFDDEDNFKFTWGRGVLTGGGEAEVCDHTQAPCLSGDDDGAEGGMLDNPYGIAIDQDTGHVFVGDRDNRRVQEFEADGTFVRAWGRDVVSPGGLGNVAGNEVQKVEVTGGTVATFTLRFRAFFDGSSVDQTTGPIDRNASAAEVDAALGGLAAVDASDVDVTGPSDGPWEIEFVGSLATVDVTTLQASARDLAGNRIFGVIDVETLVEGGGFETCRVASECTRGGTTSDPGGFGGSSPPAVDVQDSTGDVFVADPGTSSSADNWRVQRFDVPADPADPVPAPTAADIFAPFDSGHPDSIAVDDEVIYASSGDNQGAAVWRYDLSASSFIEPLDLVELTGGVPAGIEALKLDPQSGNLLVGRVSRGFSSEIQTTEVVEIGDPDATDPADVVHVDTHVAALGEVRARLIGIEVDPDAERLYIVTPTTSSGAASSQVLVADADGSTPAKAFIDPPSEVTGETAKLSGCVDPVGGVPANYRFQHSRDGIEWTDVAAPIDLGAEPIDCGDPANKLEAQLTGLDRNTLYKVRILSQKLGNPSVGSPETFFITDAPGPDATTLPVYSHADTEALLTAEIDPNGSPTSYYFEWGRGIGTKYTHRAPAGDGDAGSDSGERVVTAAVSGLEPDTDYHYRVVAENPQGETVGEDETFATRPAGPEFAERAYEQVSPIEKNGAQFTNPGGELLLSGAPAAADGEALAFGAKAAFADAEFGATPSQGQLGLIIYQARRNADGSGWTTKSTAPRPAGVYSATDTPQPSFFGGPSDSLAAINAKFPFEAPEAPGGGYLRDLRSGELTKFFERDSADESLVGASADFEHIVFHSNAVLTEDAGVPAGGSKVYEWVDGDARLVSFDESGSPFAGAATAAPHGSGRGVISDDGRHIFFSTPVNIFGATNQTEIYRRSDGTTTALASPSQASSPDPKGSKGKVFLYATRDGDDVFFTSKEHLTDDANTGPFRAGNDLYRYRVSSDELIDISAETNDANGAQVRGLLGASEDGNWVYYAARGQVVAGQGVVGEDNVYLWHDDGSPDGETTYVATLSGDGDSPDDADNFSSSNPVARVSADGQTLLFRSKARVTSYDNAGHSQLYVYEVEEGTVSCVSCRSDGMPPQGNTEGTQTNSITGEGGDGLARSLSADGSKVFFDSVEPLVAADANGVRDVYEWQDGRLRLITSAESEAPSFLMNGSRTGGDVFFATLEGLVGQDGDGAYDFYTARIGGGIPHQSPPPPGEPCVGDACKSGVSEPPAPDDPPSREVVSEGNAVVGPDCARTAFARRAKAVSKRAQRSRRNARRVAANGKRGKAKRLRRRSARMGKRAKRLSNRAKACRRAAGGQGK